MKTYLLTRRNDKEIRMVEADECSDGYHTFSELYDHRRALFVALIKAYDTYITPLGPTTVRCWKSKLHSDGTMFDGYFIVGMSIKQIKGPDKLISYHYSLEHWDEFKTIILDRAPEYDGHTSQDVYERLMKL